MKVLLVENKEICIEVLMALLASTHKQIEACNTVEEAERRLKANPADVVIISRELATSDVFTRLSNSAIVIVTSSDYMTKAVRWTQDIRTGVLLDAVDKAAERKAAIDTADRLLQDMKRRCSENAKLLNGV